MDFDRTEPILTSPQINAAMDALSTALAETGTYIEWDSNRKGEVTFTVRRVSSEMRVLAGALAGQKPGPGDYQGTPDQFLTER